MEVTAKCAECGKDIGITKLELAWRGEDLVLSIQACSACLEKKRAEGKEEGLEEGKEEGHEAGYNEGVKDTQEERE